MTLPPIAREEFKHYIKKANKCYQSRPLFAKSRYLINYFLTMTTR